MPDINANIFENGFDANTLTVSINQAAYVPGAMMQRKLYREVPVETTEVAIELVNENLTLVKASLRGGIGDIHGSAKRSLVKFKAPHLRTRSTMLAASWQDQRGFGSAVLSDVQKEKQRVLAEHRRRLEATIEYHKVRALAGQILDADGSVLIDLHAEFNVVQTVHSLALSTDTTFVPNEIVAAKRKSEAFLGEAKPASWVAFSSASFMDKLRAHPSVGISMQGWAAATMLRDDVRTDLNIGDVQFVEVRDGAGATYIEDGAAYLVPEGVPDLFIAHFAPADYMDTVNSAGLPLYARAEPLPFNRGVALESQSNPVCIVTRPRAVVKLT